MVKGYKALSPNMAAIYGNGMQYELGKWYKVDGEIKPCENGFHFCKKLEDTHRYYIMIYSNPICLRLKRMEKSWKQVILKWSVLGFD